MRKITAHLFASVDGVVDDPSVFQFDSFGEREGELMGRALSGVTGAVLGRVIYEQWADYWPKHNDDFGLVINPIEKFVPSTTLEGPLAWENSKLIEGDLLDFVRELRGQDGGDVIVCGISVIAQLLDADLLDALTLTVHPVFVGEGRRIFDALEAPLRLELLESESTSLGNAFLTYRRRQG